MLAIELQAGDRCDVTSSGSLCVAKIRYSLDYWFPYFFLVLAMSLGPKTNVYWDLVTKTFNSFMLIVLLS